MWRCVNCDEEMEESFGSCWNCGTDRQGKVDPNFVHVELEPAKISKDDISVPNYVYRLARSGVIGACLGLSFGVAFALGAGYLATWTNPEDPSPRSITSIVVITAPGCFFLGGLFGVLMAHRRCVPGNESENH